MELNTKEAAEYIKRSVGTLELWRKKGRGPAYTQVVRAVTYKPEDIDRYLAECRVEPKDK